MTLTEQAAAIAILRDAYPRQPFPDGAVAFYARKLADYDGAELVRAVDRLTDRSTFLPSVAEIKREIAEERLSLPNVAEAWEIAEKGSLRAAPQAVRDAAEFVGGRWAILHGDNAVATRAQFREQYTHLREQALLEEVGALPERKGLPARAALPPVDPDLIESAVMTRAVRLMTDQPVHHPPTEEERRDAIRILKRGPWDPDDPQTDRLYVAAEQVLAAVDDYAKETT